MLHAVLLPVVLAAASQSKLTFVPNGLTSTHAYKPHPIMLAPSAPMSVGSVHLPNPERGSFTLNGIEFPLVVDRTKGKDWYLFVDANRNGNFSDDPPATWTKYTYRNMETHVVWPSYKGHADIDFGYGPARVMFFTNNPEDLEGPPWLRGKRCIQYYADYGMSGTAQVGNERYALMLIDSPGTAEFAARDYSVEAERLKEWSTFLIDLNKDGKFEESWEQYCLGIPFAVNGVTYEATGSGANVKFIPSTRYKAKELHRPPQFDTGNTVIPFTGNTVAGEAISFPDSFKGKVVLLDFWATWCHPCVDSIPDLRKAYSQFSSRGFEIVSVSIDQKEDRPKLLAMIKEKGMIWKHVHAGQDSELAKKYGITHVPFLLLVDGSTGKLLATEDQLRSYQLVETLTSVFSKR